MPPSPLHDMLGLLVFKEHCGSEKSRNLSKAPQLTEWDKEAPLRFPKTPRFLLTTPVLAPWQNLTESPIPQTANMPLPKTGTGVEPRCRRDRDWEGQRGGSEGSPMVVMTVMAK